MATSPSTTSGDDIHAGVNGSLVVLGDASTLSLVPFLRACRAGAAGTYRIRPELRYFTVVDTSAHERWARGGELGARERELDTRTLFLARSGDRMPHFATYAFFRPVGAARALAWLPRPVVGDYVIAHNLDALLARPAAGARAVGGDDGQGDGGGGADVELFAIGGQYFPADLGPGRRRTAGVRRRDGVNLLRARSLGHLANGSWLPWAPSARVLRPAVLLGDHAGCLDMMDRSVPIGQAGSCGFDGKFSIVRFRGRFWLYARANTRAMGGGRFVQVATSVRDDPAGPYGAFRLIQIAGYDPAVGAARSSPNIYFAAVNALPTDPSILLALFPVNLGAAAGRRPASPFVSRAAAPTAAAPTAARPGFRAADIHDGGAFLGVAASCDGVRFTRLERIAATTGVLGRTYDHPADGLILARGRVHFYVQRDVPGISPHADEHARIVRHSFRPDALARIVAHARATLEGCAPPPRAEVRLSLIHI